MVVEQEEVVVDVLIPSWDKADVIPASVEPAAVIVAFCVLASVLEFTTRGSLVRFCGAVVTFCGSLLTVKLVALQYCPLTPDVFAEAHALTCDVPADVTFPDPLLYKVLALDGVP